MVCVDFHMHTTHSDGSYAPRDLIRYCKQKSLRCVSVTDHDTMSSFQECADEAGKLGLEIVPGVEISAQFEPGTLHILGFFLNPEDPKVQVAFKDIQQARRERNPRLVEKLKELGINISLEEILEDTYGGTQVPPGKQLGRPHFAAMLVKKGYVKTTAEAFDKYLSKGKPAYVDKRRVSGQEAVRLIREAGGIASVAHPKQMRLDPENLEREIRKLADKGLEAIEVYNSCQNADDNQLFHRIAQKFDLIETGGSDFHGVNKPYVDLGQMGEDVRLGYEMVEAMRERIAKRT